MTDKQFSFLTTLYREQGWSREIVIKLAAEKFKRPIKVLQDLTIKEASELIQMFLDQRG